MLYPILTYSCNPEEFPFDLTELHQQRIESFLISGSNALIYPAETLAFMREFDS